MKVSQVRVLTGTAVTAATLAMAVGMSAVSANAAPAPARGSTSTAAAAASKSSVAAPVTGTFKNADGTGTFSGTFSPKAFHVTNGVLEATGLLTGTMKNANGTSLGSVSRTVTLPVNTTAASADPSTCNVLNLTLGPVNLNLLGLVVTLNQVHLNISAVPGAGNLLGNLLCSVANLLNSGGSLSTIAGLLNQILALL